MRDTDEGAEIGALFHAVYPRLVAAAGKTRVDAWLADYLDAFAPRDWERLERLRTFQLFLRNERRLGRLERSFWVDIASWEWAEFNCLYSPADEERTRRALKPRERVLNPTAQILQLHHDLYSWMEGRSSASSSEAPREERQMIFIYRAYFPGRGFHVRRHLADALTAAVVDPLLEEGRLTEEHFLREIESQYGEGGRLAAPVTAWSERITSLVENQLIIEGS
ncbi:MAG: hypothetical protein NDI61_10500 [Bdellovibrionaceae bacterium]|nr:hypothetical protein [Pseudobdellovibrionaceae bacterium]